jgi:CheY-like chemotaxis protein
MPKILTIDDEVEFTNIISNYFAPRGFDVLIAHSGEQALDIAHKQNPDVFLIDLKMPGLHGDEVMRMILKNQPSAKCIMITASEGEEKVRNYLMKLGAFACFDKPLTSLRDLEDKIREALGR